eukprot:RCo046949
MRVLAVFQGVCVQCKQSLPGNLTLLLCGHPVCSDCLLAAGRKQYPLVSCSQCSMASPVEGQTAASTVQLPDKDWYVSSPSECNRVVHCLVINPSTLGAFVAVLRARLEAFYDPKDFGLLMQSVDLLRQFVMEYGLLQRVSVGFRIRASGHVACILRTLDFDEATGIHLNILPYAIRSDSQDVRTSSDLPSSIWAAHAPHGGSPSAASVPVPGPVPAVPHPGTPPPAAKSSADWACHRCTLLNPSSSSECSMCSTPRAGPRPPEIPRSPFSSTPSSSSSSAPRTPFDPRASSSSPLPYPPM